MENQSFTIALCQMRIEAEEERNLQKAEAMIREAAAAGARFVCLPEMFHCPYEPAAFRAAWERGHENLCTLLSYWAMDCRVYLIAGSICEKDGPRLYNTSFVYDPSGREIARHRKVHLFDVNLPELCFRESDSFTPGSEATVFDTQYGPMGLGVCFDGRFPELFRAQALRGAKLIFLPAQFNTVTGPLHWELMLRSRALDNQVFFAGTNAAWNEASSYRSWGHSTVVDPLGQVAATCDEAEQILYCEVDFARVDETRRHLPLLESLRRDVYPVLTDRQNAVNPAAPAPERTPIQWDFDSYDD